MTAPCASIQASARTLDVTQASVHLGRSTVLQDVSVRLEAGKFHAIIGPNGSGKSTLLKAITGEHAYTGEISLNGLPIRNTRPEELAALRGVLAQHTSLSFPLTVSEVIGLGLSAQSFATTHEERKARTAEALGKVDLAGFEGRMVHDLSGGEQQRVHLARVLCQVWEPVSADGAPRWLFLDEPVSSLDIKHQVQIMDLAADYARQGGGVLAVMHDLNLTANYAGTVLALRGGRRIAHGPVAEVYRNETLSRAFDHPIEINTAPRKQQVPFVLPIV
ncbi:heme ABC transporter ATP-binding protein [Roseibium sp. RKSG952]|uniref:heme ABC transporter ATP-binding protein n=1 Tax=Roseibium sp. RKSG952 TaxID=2529384 RepID=UPI0012BD4F80|nr:heme ABC transporter ATP-binding protein [Roseibium sp. RKSG952]MTI00182.1 heme ABC transporter ATP-binding protein [Roseibium sp. RKSG952]